MTAPVRIGCSGWNYAHWRERVYPKRLQPRGWLAHYATLFDTVELNVTFYRLPTTTAVEGWVQGTPDDFVFAAKASRYLTHLKRLRDLADGLARYYERLAPLVASPKLGPILWQLPEQFHRDDDRLADALVRLPAGRHAFEFRHASWFVSEVYALLRGHDAALVIADHPRRPFQSEELTASWTYLRFHHGRGSEGSYSPAELRRWAEKIRRWREHGPVFAYFNNDWSAYAIHDAQALRALVERPGTRAPGEPVAAAAERGSRPPRAPVPRHPKLPRRRRSRR